MKKRLMIIGVAVAALSLVAAGCGDDDATTEPDATTTTQMATTTAAPSGGGDGGGDSCDMDGLALKQDGKLTAATGEPVFPPWMMDDDPSNQMGFESAVVYAVADEMGFEAADVEWVRTGFDEAIAPGSKSYDFNIQQYTITAERDEVVDFSRSYYANEQSIIALEGSDIIGAASIADLRSANLGVQLGTTSLDYIDDIIQPSSSARVYDTNSDAKAAMDAGQIEGMVTDLPTAYYITAVEIPEASIVGVLPRAEGVTDDLGMLFEEGSPLVPCVNAALDALEADGTLEAIETEWLNQGGDIPTLTM